MFLLLYLKTTLAPLDPCLLLNPFLLETQRTYPVEVWFKRERDLFFLAVLSAGISWSFLFFSTPLAGEHSKLPILALSLV